MTDRAKVIKEFELFIKDFYPACTSEGVELDMFREVLALLKEQENCENCAIAIEDRQLIVRCKDCKHRAENHRCYADNPMRGSYVGNNWFCADGEAKDKDG